MVDVFRALLMFFSKLVDVSPCFLRFFVPKMVDVFPGFLRFFWMVIFFFELSNCPTSKAPCVETFGGGESGDDPMARSEFSHPQPTSTS